MAFLRHKKAIATVFLIELILLILGVSLLIGSMAEAFERVDDESAELSCRGTNAFRFGTSAEVFTEKINFGPRLCRTIDKKDIPSKDYVNHINGPKEGAMAEIRDMSARCWYMWLEGKQKNMFEKGWSEWGKEGCFICYTFALDKKATSFSYEDLSASMEKPYYALDTSNKCSSFGGKCMAACGEDQRETPSSKCKEVGKNKCCISKSPKDECKNRGGVCENGAKEGYTFYYPKWSCSENRCYVNQQQVASYLDYIQGTKGDGGPGKLLFAGSDGFSTGSKYAITFVSPGNDFDWSAFAGSGKGLGIAVVGRGIGYLVPYVGQAAFLVQLGALVLGSSEIINGGSPKDINYIMISKYDTAKDKCAVEVGTGEK